jgi:hypothetical protein
MAPYLNLYRVNLFILLKTLRMKKLILCAVVMTAAAMFTTASAQSNEESNVESQQKNAVDVSENVQYYYLPEIDAYYYVPRKQFIYQSAGHWTFSASLPSAHKDYDLQSGNKIVINQAGAYRFNDQHKQQYGVGDVSTAKSAERTSETGKKQLKNLNKGKG